MQPGLSRAIPLGLLGFLLGALVVIVIRAAQGMTPLWDFGVGMSLAAFTTAGFFMYGMGAFDPAMNAHGDEAVRLQEEAEKAIDTAPPARLLSGSIWTLAALTLGFIVIIFGFATLPGGLSLITTMDPEASVMMSGMVEMQLPMMAAPMEVSKLVIFAVFLIVLFVSLAAVGAILAMVFRGAAQGVAEAKVAAAAGVGGITVETGVPAPVSGRPAWLSNILTIALFVVVFAVLYLLFYYVAIGLILPAPDLPGLNILFPAPSTQLAVISAVNAALFTILILRPTLVLQFLGRIARWVARLLRRVPSALQ
ncbi:MAG: hypothetical protein SGJ24_03495 [Chloroflexota bacterium]|nr:hypothetical protein [Chloroflexota bacterium]